MVQAFPAYEDPFGNLNKTLRLALRTRPRLCASISTTQMKRARETDVAQPCPVHGEAAARPEDLSDSHAAAATTADTGAASSAISRSFTAPSAVLSIDASAYTEQLDAKVLKLKALFADMPMPDVKVHTSEPQNYRMRAEFTVRGTRPGETPHYIMFSTTTADEAKGDGDGDVEASAQPQADALADAPADVSADTQADAQAVANGGAEAEAAAGTGAGMGAAVLPDASKDPACRAEGQGSKRGRGRGWRNKTRVVKPSPVRVEITSFPVGSLLMNELMPVVLQECNKSAILKQGLFQVDYHTALSGDVVVTLQYHQKLDDSWAEAARKLRPILAAVAPSANGQEPHILGRSRKQKVCLDNDFVVEKLMVSGKQYTYRQYAGSFSQPNGKVCEKMLEWAVDATQGSHDHDLLELYCGNGNFTIPLAHNFRRVVATEMSKAGVDAAKWNIQENGVAEKVFVGRLSSEEFVETWKAQGTRRRLEGLWSWSELRMKTLFVDPPRAGLDADTVKLMASFERIVYVSCNPETLHENLKGIAGVTHDVVRFAAFDQFPFTHHLESAVYLVRRPEASAVVAAEAASAAGAVAAGDARGWCGPGASEVAAAEAVADAGAAAAKDADGWC